MIVALLTLAQMAQPACDALNRLGLALVRVLAAAGVDLTTGAMR